MNPTIERMTRDQITEGLQKLPRPWVELFNLMYGRKSGKRGVEEAKLLTISQVVTEVPTKKLDWALTQVESSVKMFDTIGPYTICAKSGRTLVIMGARTNRRLNITGEVCTDS